MIDPTDFKEKLLSWYSQAKRDLPWRNNKDPYQIWVSEIMLQQTRVDTVIPYYERFMSKFPSIDHLSDASEDEVLKVWEGLGYYSRARNLWLGVKEVKEKYEGIVPQEKEDILKLPGIGPYTSGAILSIAYGKKTPAVDGNVMRVMTRIFNLHEDIAKVKTRLMIEKLVETLMPDEQTDQFNQALMELGAVICTLKSPQCLLCPLRDICVGRREGNHEFLPLKSKKKQVKVIHRISLLIENEKEIALVKRSGQGLLANMWELPSIESDLPMSDLEWEEKIYFVYGISASLLNEWQNIQHTFSHIHWNLKIYRLDQFKGEWPKEWVTIRKERLHELTFPKAYHGVIEQLKQK